MAFSDSLYFSSKTLNQLLGQMADEAFREFGITSSYAFMLLLVDKQPGVQPMQLSRDLQLTPSTITRLVDKMEYRGLLERTSEGRSTHIRLSERGEELVPDLRRAHQALEERYRSVLGQRYASVLTEMTSKAAEQIRQADTV